MLKKFCKSLINSIKKATNSVNPKLHEPELDFLDSHEIRKCIITNYVSTVGPNVKKFEKKISNLTGAKFVIATNSGTSALHLSLKSINVDKNSEVLVPTLNFAASANAIKYCNATPHFIDSSIYDLGVDAKKLFKYLKNISKIKNGTCYNKKTKKKISALILVHIFGYSGNVLKIKRICNLFKIELIEDAAEAIGSFYKKKHLGTFGKLAALSFNGNKTITTGAGGAVITDNKQLAKKIYSLSIVSKLPHEWKLEYGSVGYNYRMPNLNAALGLSQLSKLKLILKNKRKLFLKYKKALKNFSEFELLNEPKNSKSNYWLNTIVLKFNSMKKRDFIIQKLNHSGVQARPCWKLLHKLKHFYNCPRMDLSNAEKLEMNIINLPSSAKYGKK